MKFRFVLALLVIIGTFACIRRIRLESVPPHLSNDEISIAYDSYSLLYTGRDEYGTPLPLSFKSHGTFKAPLYAYLLAPLNYFFGSSGSLAKLPSYFSGIITIFTTFYLSYLVTRNKYIALLASLVIASAPWHIYTSRMVLETNLGLLLLSLGILLFLKNSVILSPLFLSLSLYAYHTQWGLVPLLVGFMAVKTGKWLPVILFIIFSVPVFSDYMGKIGTSARANVEVIWNDPGVNTPGAIVKVFLSNYFSYVNPGYLFFNGLGLFTPESHPYQSGLFLWPLIIPFTVGLFRLKKYVSRTHYPFFVYWTLISPAIPALTHGGNSLLRNLPSILPYSIITGIGLVYFYRNKIQFFGVTLLWFLFFLLFLAVYLVHFPVETAATYQGYAPIVRYLKGHSGNFETVRIDDRFGIDNQFSGVPHLYLGYFLRLDPISVQNRKYLPDGTYMDMFIITWINWREEKIVPKTWYVVSVGNRPPDSVKSRLEFVSSFPDAGGRPAFEIWAGR